MMNANDRSLRSRLEPSTGWPPLPRRGAWVFVPTDLAEDAFGVWHADEPLAPASGEPIRAERVVRLSGGAASGVAVLVWGVVLHGGGAPLVLRSWHRAVRA